MKSGGSRFWRGKFTIDEREWPRLALHEEDMTLRGPVMAGPFMQMLKSQQQA